MNRGLRILVFALTIIAGFVFLASCVITLSDGQGALIFIFSIPIMFVLLASALGLSRKIKKDDEAAVWIKRSPKILAGFLGAFFVVSFFPGSRKLSDAFMGLVGKSFVYATGKTPYAFFKDRASFSAKLEEALKAQKKINFSDLDVTFAWDRVCVFGPYTNAEKARSVLNIDWNIEERSQIHLSDSINALVFLYQGRVNQVVDLKRSITDFKNLDICLFRNDTVFEAGVDLNGLRYLKL